MTSRRLIGLALLVSMLAGCSYSVGAPVPAATQPSVYRASVGEAVTITEGASPVGRVTVVSIDRSPAGGYHTAGAGKTLIAVSVKYEAIGQFSYNPFDWSLHDDQGNLISNGADWYPDSGGLDSGQLAAGLRRSGSIGFEIPAAIAHLYAAYAAGFGGTLFTVQLF